MRDTQATGSDRIEEPSHLVNYLPGMPRISPTSGRVERLLKRLFRRRGDRHVVVRRRD